MTEHSRRRKLPRRSAQQFLSRGQMALFYGILFAALVGLVFGTRLTLRVIVSMLLVFYACFMLLKAVLHYASLRYKPPAVLPAAAGDPTLPVYTVLVPLFHEAGVLKQLMEWLRDLHYPKDKLQVLLLLEEDDIETRAAAQVLGDMGYHYELVFAPAIPKGQEKFHQPQGKPRALNIGLARATGEYTVIFDAEDRPEADQLLKAVAAFRASPHEVACVQARLQFWNEDTSWPTRNYWAEYVVHFCFVLPGLVRLRLPVPLGGTSNHFRTDVLREIAFPQDTFPELPGGTPAIYAWDSPNVTEDADIGMVLAEHGYRTTIIDSVTYEEATAMLRRADKQRRRWLKGYFVTGGVHSRHPFRGMLHVGPVNWFCFNLLMLGTPFSLILNPIFWGMTITYLAAKLGGHAGVYNAIDQLFPTPVFYTGVMLMVVGNLLLFWQLLTACLHRDGYGSIKFMLLVPVWWLFTSWSAYRILPELAVPALRSQWNHTEHGHDMHKEGARLETAKMS